MESFYMSPMQHVSTCVTFLPISLADASADFMSRMPFSSSPNVASSFAAVLLLLLLHHLLSGKFDPSKLGLHLP
jgi:hypothetical protein